MKDKVVKIDSELLKKIEELVRKNKFLYSSKKQVVNLAIIEFLNKKSINLSEKSSTENKFSVSQTPKRKGVSDKKRGKYGNR